MPSKFDDTKGLRCSFCGKNQDQVRRLIAGPQVYICDECIELCSEIIEEGVRPALVVQGQLAFLFGWEAVKGLPFQ